MRAEEFGYEWSRNRFIPSIQSLSILIVAVMVGLSTANSGPNSGGMLLGLAMALLGQLTFYWTIFNLIVLLWKLLKNP